jgi:hypothetical protein
MLGVKALQSGLGPAVEGCRRRDGVLRKQRVHRRLHFSDGGSDSVLGRGGVAVWYRCSRSSRGAVALLQCIAACCLR